MKLYFKFFAIHLKSQMQYKVSFFLTVIGQVLTSFSAFLAIYFMMNRFHTVNGFSAKEVFLCYGVIWMSVSVAECFFRGFDCFSSTISNGEFDRIMVRPRNEMLLTLCSKIELSIVGRFVQALGVLIYSVVASEIVWTGWKIFLLTFMICSGVILFSGLYVIYASLCFFTTEGLEFMNIFTDGGREFGTYPLSIYGKRVLRFFTFIVPMATVQYYPFMYLIGKSDNIALAFAPLSVLVFLIPCLILWKIGVKHYKSTGS